MLPTLTVLHQNLSQPANSSLFGPISAVYMHNHTPFLHNAVSRYAYHAIILDSQYLNDQVLAPNQVLALSQHVVMLESCDIHARFVHERTFRASM